MEDQKTKFKRERKEIEEEINRIVNGLTERKALYGKALQMEKDALLQTVEEIMKIQEPDGSFGLDKRPGVPFDCRVAYVYVPSYYCTAVMMRADLLSPAPEGSRRAESFSRALEFCLATKLKGSGFEAMRGLMDAIGIFADAGLYRWMKREENAEKEFTRYLKEVLAFMEQALEEGNTVFDWEQDFSAEFTETLRKYYDVFWPADKTVWYMAYGSNLSSARFEEYLDRCTNPARPQESRPFRISYGLYFAGSSGRWNHGGTAFLNLSEPGYVMARIYKITMEQLNEIQKMEGAWYQRRVYLGKLEEIPMFTFTCTEVRKPSFPDRSYLDTILQGIKEIKPLPKDTILQYYLYEKVLQNNHLRILNVLREAPHGITLFEAAEKTNLTIAEVRDCILPMEEKLHLVRQDRRSAAQGHEKDDGKAVYYTERKDRDLIDLLILNWNIGNL